MQILSLTSVTLCCNQSSFSPTNVMHFHTYILTRRDKKESKDFQSRQKSHLVHTWQFGEIAAFVNFSILKLKFCKIAQLFILTPVRTLSISGLKSQVLKSLLFNLKVMAKNGLDFFLKSIEPLKRYVLTCQAN